MVFVKGCSALLADIVGRGYRCLRWIAGRDWPPLWSDSPFVISLMMTESWRTAMSAGGRILPTKAVVHGPRVHCSDDVTILDLFQRRVAEAPEAPAVVHGGEVLSYGRLDRLANGLAARLSADGLGRGDLVPLLMVGGTEVLVAMLATMKVAAAVFAAGQDAAARVSRVGRGHVEVRRERDRARGRAAAARRPHLRFLHLGVDRKTEMCAEHPPGPA
jgi:hypothetical protein